MNPSKRKYPIRAVALPALIVALLTAGVGQPAHAQGGLFKKLQGAAKTLKDKAEKADTTLTKAEETSEAMGCLLDSGECAEQRGAQESPSVMADSSHTSLSTPGAVGTVPGQCENTPRAPPDTVEA
jgi:hypothetical protein